MANLQQTLDGWRFPKFQNSTRELGKNPSHAAFMKVGLLRDLSDGSAVTFENKQIVMRGRTILAHLFPQFRGIKVFADAWIAIGWRFATIVLLRRLVQHRHAMLPESIDQTIARHADHV